MDNLCTYQQKVAIFLQKICGNKKIALYLQSQNRKMVCSVLIKCGNSSVGRAQPCQGWGREFESRFPLQESK